MRQQILGIDYGLHKLGLAIADLGSHLVTPLCILEGDVPQFLNEVSELVRRQDICRVVVGVPYRNDGSPSATTAAALNFIGQLRERIKMPVVSQDERFTTKAATAQLKHAKLSIKKKGDDALAAAYILQSYLDRSAAGTFV